MTRAAAPLVSIGIPVYNGERFLGHALDSLLAQSLGDLEIIVSDNASTDRTADICAEYVARDSRVRYLRQPTNIGATRNFNVLPRQARGRYFKWHSANDYCAPRMLELCVGAMEQDPGVILCHGRTALVDEDTGEAMPYDGDVGTTDARPSARFAAASPRLVLNNELFAVMRLDVLRRTPLNRPYEGGDLVLVLELCLHGRFLLLPETLHYRRVGGRTDSMQLPPAKLQAFLHGKERKAWVDPAWWRRLDLTRAVLRAPIGMCEKLRTLAQAAHRAATRFATHS